MSKASTKTTSPTTSAKPEETKAETPKPSVGDLLKLFSNRREALDLLEAQKKDIENQFAVRLAPFAGLVIKHPETGIISKVIKGQYGYCLRAMESQALRDAREALGA